MMKIKYESVTGEIMEIDVPDEVAEVCIEIEDSTKKQERRETRRHVLLSVLEAKGVQVSENTDIETETIESGKIEQLQNALKKLLPEQQELIFKVFFCEQSIAEIAKEEGVTIPAIYSRLNTIYRKLKEIMFLSLIIAILVAI
ncbi:RNA polymerase sigma factor [Cellulosilyticum sp. WCF-2]|uniref:RNA polymerase sigma factor n=1 Tax=Cellulosilyticum sp. WCF-2 TaxID=2497860 RepID=UPI000F8C50DB|nr:sigma-70 family RNA polymerase sigma factor [Cellulosilyticum sp. WCF-2]QEH69325.1 sigma-70 family RNA polymerase sigma factor [Cellulosilyticum sp. WCF-2]